MNIDTAARIQEIRHHLAALPTEELEALACRPAAVAAKNLLAEDDRKAAGLCLFFKREFESHCLGLEDRERLAREARS